MLLINYRVETRCCKLRILYIFPISQKDKSILVSSRGWLKLASFAQTYPLFPAYKYHHKILSGSQYNQAKAQITNSLF